MTEAVFQPSVLKNFDLFPNTENSMEWWKAFLCVNFSDIIQIDYSSVVIKTIIHICLSNF